MTTPTTNPTPPSPKPKGAVSTDLVVNPTTFTITDTTVAADSVTAFRVLFGQTAGGPYPLMSAPIPLANLTVNADGTITGKIAALNESLAPGTWFAVVEAENANGDSGNSPEVSFVIQGKVPQDPTGFTVA